MAAKINRAHRYEAAWHEWFWKLPEFKQIEIIEEPLGSGRTQKEHAKAVRILAEDDKFKHKKNYRDIPTGVADLREIKEQKSKNNLDKY